MVKGKHRVLIVDDETDFAEDTAVFLSDRFQCDVVGDPSAGMEAIRKRSYALVLLDIDLQAEEDGIALLRRMKEFDPGLPVVMLTKLASVSDVVESIRAGAFHYVIKSTESMLQELGHVCGLAIEDARMRTAVAWMAESAAGDALDGFVGSSPPMMRIKEEIRRVAPLDCSVLILGDSGVGKELVARALHALSGRASSGPFVPVNCAALQRELVESELFGHERGAFTGADRQHKGKFEYAIGGTLFLDEIGDMPRSAQAKMLRVLEEKEFTRVGGNQQIETDARVVSATNHDLEREVEQGGFRGELRSRLNRYTIHIPPLRERREDIPEIAMHLVRMAGSELGKGPIGISRSALDSLSERDWASSNVRELKNAIVGAAIRCAGDTIQAEDIGYETYDAGEDVPEYEVAKDRVLTQFQRKYVSHLLRATGGNAVAAAARAGIARKTLYEILKKLNLDPDEFRKPETAGA
jgi:two-component system response regulator AtoC